MKHILLVLLIAFSATAFGQKTITVTQRAQEVPSGKKWVLKAGNEMKVELARQSLSTQSYCGQMIFTTLRTIAGVVEGEYGKMPKNIYAINISQIEKVPYTSIGTYSVIPFVFTDSDQRSAMGNVKKLEEVGVKQLTFYQGQSVYVSNCLMYIEMLEYNLTGKEIAELKNKIASAQALEIKAEEQREKEAIQREEEKKEQIANSQNFYSRFDLANNEKIKLTINGDALKILNSFVNELRKTSNKQDKLYEDIKIGDQFIFNILFDKQGKLNKVELNRYPRSGENIKVEVPQIYFKELTDHISISEFGKIWVGNERYPVNSEFDFYLKTGSIRNRIDIAVIKDKKGGLKVLSNQYKMSFEKQKDAEILEFLRNQERIAKLEKGKYEIVVIASKGKLKGIHNLTKFKQQVFEVEVDEMEVQDIKSI
jgi:hypothetical protein